MSVEVLCAQINDASSICDQCEICNTEFPAEEEHQEIGERLCRAFMKLTMFTANHLCERIMLDMQDPEPILTTVGNEALWASSNAARRTNATLGDYFEDLEEWIHPHFFPKCLNHCFDLTLDRYFEMLREQNCSETDMRQDGGRNNAKRLWGVCLVLDV